MNDNAQMATTRLDVFSKILDIPQHHYELATRRYKSLADWMCRDESSVAKLGPTVYAQGSFRLGTVIRPLTTTEEYDLDLVTELKLLAKLDQTQADLKRLVGNELKAYAKAKSVKGPVEEKKRCWRLDYADQVQFHMDVLPALPDDEVFKSLLVKRGIPENQAIHAIAITDNTSHGYTAMTNDWPRSNPAGFARWFDLRMRAAAEERLQALLERRVYTSVEDIPTHEWKTPLQRAIQIMKRHRDVMFKDNPRFKPISMILTTLSAKAYESEMDLYEVLKMIIDRMAQLVSDKAPRITNPVDPGEDFADKWKSDHRLEKHFWEWRSQFQSDLARLASALNADDVQEFARKKLGIQVDDTTGRELASTVQRASLGVAVPRVTFTSSPRPWTRRA